MVVRYVAVVLQMWWRMRARGSFKGRDDAERAANAVA